MSRYRWGLGALLGAFLAVAHGSVAIGLPAVGPDDPVDLAESVIRCVVIDGENFCTEIGFIDARPGTSEWRSYIEGAMADSSGGTGDMTLGRWFES